MPEPASENSFLKGLDLVRRGEYLEARAYFEASMQLVKRTGIDPPPMKYLSYYGLCLAFSSDRLEEARAICEGAVAAEVGNPDLHLNLGQVYLKIGDRAAAFATLQRGLVIDPRHDGLARQVQRLGVRRRPVVRFLSRRHPMNRLLGRLSAALRRSTGAGSV